MKVFVSSLGCSKNWVDSEYLKGMLLGQGHTFVEMPDIAQIIIVNTCGFISSAVEEGIQTILELATLKKEGVCEQLLVFGCMVQRYGEQLVVELSEVDFFTGVGAFEEIATAIKDKKKKQYLPIVPQKVKLPDFSVRFPSSGNVAYIKIAEGCDRHCTYCIIPKIRGSQKSRQKTEILKEAQKLVKEGAKELVLVAQETTAWGRDFSSPESFSSLLEALAQQESNVWIRFLYGHPESITPELIHVVKKYDHVCSYFDVPIQHASDDILKRMGRTETREKLFSLFQYIKREIPKATLRTTVIVGFPGETQKDFKTLLDFIEKNQFDHLGAFIYSAEKDLPASALSGAVSFQTAKRRYARLMEQQQKISYEKNRQLKGKIYSVLLEEKLEPTLYAGRTQFQAPDVDGEVIVEGKEMTVGDRVSVRITETLAYDLQGERI